MPRLWQILQGQARFNPAAMGAVLVRGARTTPTGGPGHAACALPTATPVRARANAAGHASRLRPWGRRESGSLPSPGADARTFVPVPGNSQPDAAWPPPAVAFAMQDAVRRGRCPLLEPGSRRGIRVWLES